ILKASVVSQNVSSFLPVLTVYDSSGTSELACSVADSQASTSLNLPASGSAYVFPNADGTPQTYYIRVAQPVDQVATARQSYDLYVWGRDITPPRISVTLPKSIPQVGETQTYNAEGSQDLGTGVDGSTASWTFHDGFVATPPVTGSLTASHRWK